MMDFNKPYGESLGAPPFPGAKYDQDGKYYNVDGEEVFVSKVKRTPPVKGPEPTPVEESVPVKEESMEDVIMSMIADGQKRTDIAAAFGITHQKVTSIVRQAGK